MRNITEMKEELLAVKGLEFADLVLLNAKVVFIHTEEVLNSGCVYIKNGRVIAIHHEHKLKAKEEFDCKGKYLIPGLIDGHIHIEPTLLTPEALGDVIVPHGTTTLLTDAMEIGNVAGLEGVRDLMKASEGQIKYNMFLEVPSRVPTAPGLETTGGVMGLEEVTELLGESYSVSMGELDPSKVLGMKEEYLEKINAAHRLGKIANGHAAGLQWDDLNIYALAGLTDDHECVYYEELLERIRLGMTVMIREGSTERNIETLITGVLEHKLPTEYILFCTDDKHAHEIKHEGHINYMVNKAIELGLDPLKALKIATINTAKHFRIDHILGSITPGKWADILLVEDLKNISPTHVFFHGELVAENGKILENSKQGIYPEYLLKTVKLSDDFGTNKFEVLAIGDSIEVKTINIYPDQIINFKSIENLPIKDGKVCTDLEKDILKLAVVERYGVNGDVGVGFVRGFGFSNGALACSVAHDHHNIVVVGSNDDDMALAVKTVEKYQGGLVAVSDGEIKGVLPLPIAGLMSDLDAPEVIERIEALNEITYEMGCKIPSPFMSLSFISLPTVPELGLTDKGLVEVKSHSIISLFEENKIMN